MNLREVLMQAGEPIAHVYFVDQGIVSVLAENTQERIEVGMVGPEGLVGLPVVLGVDRSAHVLMVQAEGEALRIPAAELQAAMDRSSSLRALLARYVFDPGVWWYA